MANSTYTDQVIDEHVGSSTRGSALAMSARRRKAWQTGHYNESAVEGNAALPHRSSNSNRAADEILRRRWHFHSMSSLAQLLVLIAIFWIAPASAAFIEFDNCLSETYLNSDPQALQFVPYYVDAVFNTTAKSHNLLIKVFGNVTGNGPDFFYQDVPNSTDPYWESNSTAFGGKIIDIPDGNSAAPKITTLANKLTVLSYVPYDNDESFCDNLVNGTCPLGPSWDATVGDPYSYPSFNLSYDLYSSYAFTSLTATLLVKYGDDDATSISCVSANITPDLGSTLSGLLKYIPVLVLVFVAFSTAFAGIWSPWGSSDTFRWTTNYGRDEDLLRLVTPGFGDCLQYIQFIALTGSLSLNYPGFYQPITSKAAWSTLMFNQSFASHENGTYQQPLQDGIYVLTGDYGLNRTRQLVGMEDVTDVWVGMAVWLLVIVAAVLAFIQAGFLFRWIYRHINKIPEEDLRAKNFPFSVGNVIRIVFNYFLLPIVALSMFQLAIAPSGQSPAYATALAVVMLALILIFGIWLSMFIARAKPKSYLYDDLPTLLMYGALYNTYSDNAAGFALAPMTITFVRGIAIGAVQGSGIAQIVLLAICEVIFIITLHAFRPFHGPTSMNAYHTIFSAVRLTTVFLMISFAPSLGVTDGPKGWIGYVILILHVIVLGVGFWINSLQTIVEVVARLAGAGGEARGGLVKVFGHRQLSRRLPRGAGVTSRQSQLSSAAMLNTEDERKSYMMDGSGRLRSQSAGSTGILLNRNSTGLDSIGVDPYGAIPPQQLTSAGSSYTPTTPGEASTFSYLPSATLSGRDRVPVGGIAAAEAAPFYYRPPRPRRPTLEENNSPAERSRGSWASADWANKRWSEHGAGTPEQGDEGPSISRRGTPVLQQQPIDGAAESRRSQADYTTREVDFYYGIRGPALNANTPNRKIRTGPADPTGPAASAAGWFKSLFGGKTKEKGKGFEVVRSSRMPPGMKRPGEETPPEGVPVATGGVRNGPIDSDDESVHARSTRPGTHADVVAEAESIQEGHLVSPLESEDEALQSEDDDFEITRISDVPPTIPGLELPEEGIELPSRFPSKATSRASSKRTRLNDIPLVPGVPTRMPSRKPSVPRKSSRRKSQSVDLSQSGAQFLRQHQGQPSLDSSRLPFERSNSHNRTSTISTNSSAVTPETAGHSRTPSTALGRQGADFRDDRPTSVGYVHQHSIHTVNPSENPDFLGASAEVVGGSRSSGGSGGSSMEHERS